MVVKARPKDVKTRDQGPMRETREDLKQTEVFWHFKLHTWAHSFTVTRVHQDLEGLSPA